MRGQRNTRTTFRPQLECLEEREVLSTASPLASTSPLASGLSSLYSNLSGSQNALASLLSGLQGQSGRQLNAQQALALQIFAAYPSTCTSTGFLIDTLTPGAAAEAHGMIAQVNQLANDQNQLANDLNRLANDQTKLANDQNNGANSKMIAADKSAIAADNSTIAADYGRATSLYSTIKSEASSIQSQATTDQYILTAAEQSGTLNSTDMLQAQYALNQINRALQVANFELGQANNVVNTQEPNNFPTIASHG
jgi:hypothetical protein